MYVYEDRKFQTTRVENYPANHAHAYIAHTSQHHVSHLITYVFPTLSIPNRYTLTPLYIKSLLYISNIMIYY